jgi:hypothetical protein
LRIHLLPACTGLIAVTEKSIGIDRGALIWLNCPRMADRRARNEN